MEQRLFPKRVSGDRIQVIQAHQLALLQIIQQRRTILGYFSQRQIDSPLTTLFDTQAGSL